MTGVSWSGGGEPATQEGGYDFITHWDTPGVYTVTASCCGSSFSKQVTIYQVDLIVEDLSEEQEEDPGKGILVNDDDDNNNGTADNLDVTVVGEDDLVEIGLSITPTLSSGSVMLEAWYEGDVCPIKLWLSPTKGTELTMYQDMAGHSIVGWVFPPETLPTLLYVEGYRAGDVVLDFSCNNVAWYDAVVFHVCNQCSTYVDGHCISKCNLLTECCLNGECKDCCKDATTGNCEAHNSDCGCDPIGLGDCTGNIKEWTLGVTHYCWSECGGWPCNYILTEIPCYARQACSGGSIHFDSICIGTSYCQWSLIGFCQECIPVGDAYVVIAYDCQCH